MKTAGVRELAPFFRSRGPRSHFRFTSFIGATGSATAIALGHGSCGECHRGVQTPGSGLASPNTSALSFCCSALVVAGAGNFGALTGGMANSLMGLGIPGAVRFVTARPASAKARWTCSSSTVLTAGIPMLNKASRPLRQARDKLRAWYLWAVAKGALKNGKAEAAPLSETTTTAARTAPAATGSLKPPTRRAPLWPSPPLSGAVAFAPVYERVNAVAFRRPDDVTSTYVASTICPDCAARRTAATARQRRWRHGRRAPR